MLTHWSYVFLALTHRYLNNKTQNDCDYFCMCCVLRLFWFSVSTASESLPSDCESERVRTVATNLRKPPSQHQGETQHCSHPGKHCCVPFIAGQHSSSRYWTLNMMFIFGVSSVMTISVISFRYHRFPYNTVGLFFLDPNIRVIRGSLLFIYIFQFKLHFQ